MKMMEISFKDGTKKTFYNPQNLDNILDGFNKSKSFGGFLINENICYIDLSHAYMIFVYDHVDEKKGFWKRLFG